MSQSWTQGQRILTGQQPRMLRLCHWADTEERIQIHVTSAVAIAAHNLPSVPCLVVLFACNCSYCISLSQPAAENGFIVALSSIKSAKLYILHHLPLSINRKQASMLVRRSGVTTQWMHRGSSRTQQNKKIRLKAIDAVCVGGSAYLARVGAAWQWQPREPAMPLAPACDLL